MYIGMSLAVLFHRDLAHMLMFQIVHLTIVQILFHTYRTISTAKLFVLQIIKKYFNWHIIFSFQIFF